MARKYYGLKKFGITVGFSFLSVLRYFLRPGFTLGLNTTGRYSDDPEWREILLRYKQAIEEVEINECVDGGKTEQFCRSSTPIAA